MLDWLFNRTPKPIDEATKHLPFDSEVVECENALGEKFWVVRYWLKYNELEDGTPLTYPAWLGKFGDGSDFKPAYCVSGAYQFQSLEEANAAIKVVWDWKKEHLSKQVIQVRVVY